MINNNINKYLNSHNFYLKNKVKRSHIHNIKKTCCKLFISSYKEKLIENNKRLLIENNSRDEENFENNSSKSKSASSSSDEDEFLEQIENEKDN